MKSHILSFYPILEALSLRSKRKNTGSIIFCLHLAVKYPGRGWKQIRFLWIFLPNFSLKLMFALNYNTSCFLITLINFLNNLESYRRHVTEKQGKLSKHFHTRDKTFCFQGWGITIYRYMHTFFKLIFGFNIFLKE